MKLSLKEKLIGIIGVSSLVLTIISIGIGAYFNKREMISGLESKSDIIFSRLNAAGRYVAIQGGLDQISRHYLEKYKSAKDLSPQEKESILKHVPIYAAMDIGKFEAEKNFYEFRVFSDYPRNKKNLASDKEFNIINEFRKNPEIKKIVREEFNKVISYYPVKLSENTGCMYCHGDPVNSPWKDGTDILGYPMENWKDGYIHGVFAISNDMNIINNNLVELGKWPTSYYLTGFIGTGSILSLFFAMFYINKLVASLQNMTRYINKSEKSLKVTSDHVLLNSNKLDSNSNNQSQTIDNTISQIKSLDKIFNESSLIVSSIQNEIDNSIVKVSEGSSSLQKLRETMTEINNVQMKVSKQVESNNLSLVDIIEIINEIEQKTKIVDEIVFQTKLLSFNASVEASRAGEHGKGFSVVAVEIGNLAKMSGDASLEINQLLSKSIFKVKEIIDKSSGQIEEILNESNKKIELGILSSTDCEVTFSKIYNSIKEVSEHIHQITDHVGIEKNEIQLMFKSLKKLETVVNENIKISKNTYDVSSKLTDESKSISTIVTELNRLIYRKQQG